MKIRLSIGMLGAMLLVSASLAGCGKSGDGAATASAGGDGNTPAASRSRRRGPTPEDLHPTVLIRTSLGEITAKLDAEKAPLTVDNFLRYAASGHYAGTIFHQIDTGFIALGGGYTPDLQAKPTDVPVRNEAHNGLKNRRGTLAMFRQPDVIDSSTCQFFINLAENVSLDHQPQARGWAADETKGEIIQVSTAPEPAVESRAQQYGYCVFGEIIAGEDVLDKLGKTQVHAVGAFDKLPIQPVTIISVQRIK